MGLNRSLPIMKLTSSNSFEIDIINNIYLTQIIETVGTRDMSKFS